MCIDLLAHSELPPRTRRIPIHSSRAELEEGTTSAHAENTDGGGCQAVGVRNYLRARGEYALGHISGLSSLELPPRTRRIPLAIEGPRFAYGTTSAHAENTLAVPRPHAGQWNYLRARGEYSYDVGGLGPIAELPPRTRRIPHSPSRGRSSPGTTSAHAENTSSG